MVAEHSLSLECFRPGDPRWRLQGFVDQLAVGTDHLTVCSFDSMRRLIHASCGAADRGRIAEGDYDQDNDYAALAEWGPREGWSEELSFRIAVHVG